LMEEIKGIFFSLGDSVDKIIQEGKQAIESIVKNEADELERKGQEYEKSKRWREAGECYNRAGQHHLRERNDGNAVVCFANAAKCFEQGDCDTKDILAALIQVVKLYRLQHKILMCADFQTRVGELYESLENYQGAFDAYNNSGKLYEEGNYNAKAHQCLIKAGDLSSVYLGQFEDAAELFEKAAGIAKGDVLLQHTISEVLFKAGICYFCSEAFDLPPIRAKVDMYSIDFPNFGSTRQAKFLHEIVRACEKLNLDVFEVACSEEKIEESPWNKKMISLIRDKYDFDQKKIRNWSEKRCDVVYWV